MAEVSDAVGFSRSRSADYIAVNLWPSRGLTITGIEVKSYRSDWLSELKKPAKAENIYQYCDYFYLLTIDDTIAKLEEIPATWGWLCVKGSVVKTMKEAPRLEAKPVSRHFMCAMLKRACNKEHWVHEDSIEERIEVARALGEKTGKQDNQYKAGQYDQLSAVVKEFEEASGINMNCWRPKKKIGAAVQFLNDGGAEGLAKKLVKLKVTADFICKTLADQLADPIFHDVTPSKADIEDI